MQEHSFFSNTLRYSKTEKYLFAFISLAIITFLVIRAVLVPMTYDECNTFFMYVQSGDFIPFINHTDGNNHLLNTSLTYIFFHLFGSSPLTLRLSNLIFAPLYFYFCFRLSEQLVSRVTGWIFFITLAFSFHFIEFLALSRGYGIAATFLLGSIWQWILGVRIVSAKHIFISLGFIFAASAAILTLLYSYAILLALSVLFFAFEFRKIKWAAWLTLIPVGIAPFYGMVRFAMFTKENGGYFDGDKISFWRSTLVTLFTRLGGWGPKGVNLALLILIAMMVIPLPFIMYGILKRRSENLFYPLIFPLLLAGNIIFTYVMVSKAGLTFPSDRMAFHFYPLIIGTAVFLIDMAIRSSRIKWLFLLAIPLLVSPFNFIKAANTEYSAWYPNHHIPRRFYSEIMEGYRPGSTPPSVAAHPLQSHSWNFLIRENNECRAAMISNLKWPPSLHTQYLIMKPDDCSGWQKNYDTIDFDQISGRYLFKARTQVDWLPVDMADSLSTSGISTDEYFALYDGKTDELRCKTVNLIIKLGIQSYNEPILGGITITVNDSSDNNLIWEPRYVNWTRDNYDGKAENFIDNIVFDMPAKASKMYLRFVNVKKVEYSINSGAVSVSVLKGPGR